MESRLVRRPRHHPSYTPRYQSLSPTRQWGRCRPPDANFFIACDKTKRLIFLICLLVASALAQQPSATTISLGLFTTHTIHSLTVTPLGTNAWQQVCAACQHTALHAPLHIEHIDPLEHIDHPIYFGGNLRVQSEADLPSFEAAGLYTVSPAPDGLRVTLQIPSERYVAYVLSAEAAPNEPPASLEALAFVARTFALANTHRHRIEGFDLCDSTHCQALHFGPIRPAIAQAIRHTAGISLWNGSNRASVYYTQNCGGISEAASALWPVEHAPYLISHTNPYCLRRSPADWHANVSLADLDRIASEQNWQLPAPITGLRITQHTPSGRAKRLEISSPAHTAAISASSLRFGINRSLGWSRIRSDLYNVAIVGNMLHFTGQGYGHGVGLCQSGAFQMAREHHTAAGRLFMLNWSRKNRRIRYQRWCFQSWNFSSHVRSSTLSFGPQVLLTKRVQVLQPRQKLRRILHAIHAELQFIYTL